MGDIIDYVTGLTVPDIGAEANRQAVEKALVNIKGFAKDDIEVDAPIRVVLGSETYASKIDLMLSVMGKRFMAIKCAAGSLDSWQRQILAAARLNEDYQIPYAMASDGHSEIVWDVLSGKKLPWGLPTKAEAIERMRTLVLAPLAVERRHREALIFRSYDSMQLNVVR